MTDTARPPRTVDALIALRADTGARTAMRRGLSQATEHYAYPYLAHRWQGRPWARTPTLRIAGLIAVTSLADEPAGDRIGTTLRRVALADRPAPGDATDRALDRIGKRLLWAQTGDLAKFHQVLTGLLPNAPLGRIDWQELHDTYLRWGHPHPDARRRIRLRVIEDFYSPVPRAEREPDPGPADENADAPKPTQPTLI
ncbi:hypothetical protein DVS28_b0134 (plasmid) [Euzebya pacifica]|uniref:Type I-E CRISPR-associated protein Cse2/CasB n=1 Tax=Euzebya pacifica TaxID=1608957 RepID=A0A346Y607_9ACTN|nr:type I-E CRISPR-associated protein Cse2/CasB [Euzebya pacifica]AXV09904.1 hypothetical protein DVS28_b0134 [Euzebya pacifica]